MFRKYLFLSLVLTLMPSLFACSGVALVEEEVAEIIFPDWNLEAAIRTAIDKPEGPIYTTDREYKNAIASSDITKAPFVA